MKNLNSIINKIGKINNIPLMSVEKEIKSAFKGYSFEGNTDLNVNIYNNYIYSYIEHDESPVIEVICDTTIRDNVLFIEKINNVSIFG